MKKLRSFDVSNDLSEIKLLDWKGKRLKGKIALIYPNAYSLAVANLGFNRVFEIFSTSGFDVYRFVYVPGSSLLRSLDGARDIGVFKLWLFSVHYELDLFNVMRIFNASKIPALSRDRSGKHPVMVAGGALTYFMPQALLDIFDVVYLGEIEPNAVELVQTISYYYGSGRKELMEALGRLPNVMVEDSLGDKSVAVSKDTKGFAKSVFLSKKGAFGKRFLLEVERGCRRACRFCMVGHKMKPARYADLEWILEELSRAREYTRKVGLVGPTVVDHPRVEDIAVYLIEKDFDVSFSSMRVDSLSEVVMQALARHQESFTIAPEGGSQKIRNFLGKGINEMHISNAMKLGSKYGLKKVKMYFIYGTPVEEESDLVEIIRVSREAKRFFKEVRVSLNPLIPKPGTPFETLEMLDQKELKRRERFLRKELREEKIVAEFESIKDSVLQYRIARSNRGELFAILSEKGRAV